MQLYGHPHDLGSQQALLALAEKGSEPKLACERFAERARALDPNPFGEAAALVDGDFVLFGATAILRYLDAWLPGPALTPSAGRARARMDQWLEVALAQFAPPCRTLASQLVFGPLYGQAPDFSEVLEARRELAHTLDVLEGALSERYLVGAFSLADVAFAPLLAFLFQAREGSLITARPRVFAWYGRLAARASFQRVLTEACAEPFFRVARCEAAPALRACALPWLDARRVQPGNRSDSTKRSCPPGEPGGRSTF